MIHIPIVPHCLLSSLQLLLLGHCTGLVTLGIPQMFYIKLATIVSFIQPTTTATSSAEYTARETRGMLRVKIFWAGWNFLLSHLSYTRVKYGLHGLSGWDYDLLSS